MSTDANDTMQHQYPADIIYDADGAVDVRIPDNLTDWQLASLTDLEPAGQQCLINSWLTSPFSRTSIYILCVHVLS